MLQRLVMVVIHRLRVKLDWDWRRHKVLGFKGLGQFLDSKLICPRLNALLIFIQVKLELGLSIVVIEVFMS